MPRPTPTRSALTLLALLAASLAVPPAAAAGRRREKEYVVREGDILGDVAAANGCSVAELKAANGLQADLIRVGDRLRVPRCAGEKRPYAREGRARVVRHSVIPGENLGAIAERYGTTIEEIRKRNGLSSNRIFAGQELKVRANVAFRQRHEFVYAVQRGDTLGEIGARYQVSWRELQRMNPGVDPKRLRVGDRLRLWQDGPAARSEAVGRPQEGELRNAEQLPAGPGYYRRRPERAWGTNETITRLLKVIAAVRRKHRDVHDLAIGDLSAKRGGPLTGHVSHQSGRDVDIGLYFRRFPKPRPKGFIVPDAKHPLHLPAMWTLLSALVGTSDEQANVEYIFLGRRVQRTIYEWAAKQGKPRALLDRMFQYPAKEGGSGVIRHEPNHGEHLHVRFRCPARNPACK